MEMLQIIRNPMIKKVAWKVVAGVMALAISPGFLTSCEKFWEPDMGLIIETEDYFKDWSEYRSAEMGLYALQQKLVDQIVILFAHRRGQYIDGDQCCANRAATVWRPGRVRLTGTAVRDWP